MPAAFKTIFCFGFAFLFLSACSPDFMVTASGAALQQPTDMVTLPQPGNAGTTKVSTAAQDSQGVGAATSSALGVGANSQAVTVNNSAALTSLDDSILNYCSVLQNVGPSMGLNCDGNKYCLLMWGYGKNLIQKNGNTAYANLLLDCIAH